MAHDPARYGPPVSISRHLDGPDALPTGTRRTHDRRHPIGTATPIGMAMGHASELYRMRTQSHLYDERDVDFALDLERERIAPLLLADCHRCAATIPVTPDTDACPKGHPL